MPSHTREVFSQGSDAASLIAASYKALENLEWTTSIVLENILVAYTKQTWKRFSNEITIKAEDGKLTVTSKMIHGELADLPGRTKKDVAEFIAAFEKANQMTGEELSTISNRIAALQEQTVQLVETEIKEAAKVEEVMNQSKGNLHFTYGIMGINALVFVVMIVSGVHIVTPTGLDIIKWGGNFSPLTLSGDWWRLISCVFVHIGIIHLLFNMYALYTIGIYLEPMLGKRRFVAAYLGTGICASVASLWWHDTPVASAGASGAIFGLYGVFLALLSTKLVPREVRNSLLKSIGVFILFNLLYGMKSGVDNAAHIGGLLSGLVVGYVYYIGWKGENANNKKTILALAVLVISMGVAYAYMQGNKANPNERREITNILKGSSHKDGPAFLEKYNEFVEMQNRAIAPLGDKSLTNEQLLKKLDEISVPEWNKAGYLVDEIKSYDVSQDHRKKIEVMGEYVEMRKKQIYLMRQNIQSATTENDSLLHEVNREIDRLVIRFNGL